MHRPSLLFSLLLLFGTWGCGSLVQEVSPDNLPKGELKLVVHSYISPQDTLLTVLVEYPKAIIGEQRFARNPLAALGADVRLSDGTRTVQLASAPSEFGLYKTPARNLPIVAGRTYTLTVSVPTTATVAIPSSTVPGGFTVVTVTSPPTRPVTARCTVPEPIAAASLELDSLRSTVFGQSQVEYVGRLNWQDPVGPNRYRVTGKFSYETKQRVAINNVVRDTIQTTSQGLTITSATLFTDQNRNGQRFSIRGEVIRYSYSYSGQPMMAPRFQMSLLNVDENYYNYHEALDRQNTVGDNPFAEPLLIPSTIQNGLGCFGAYNQTTITVRVK